MRVRRSLLAVGILVFTGRPVGALELGLPTPNTALFESGQAAAFYQPTVEGTVESGMFGCVRRGGRRFHEGIDIKSVQRDRRGESSDPVTAAAVGRVAFINHVAGRSNYGRYLILEHRWDDVSVVTLYAHLREIADELRAGDWVERGQRIATLGRTTNTREGISPDRAHLHFEVGFMVNPNFRIWYARRDPKAPPFGNYNGQNFIGLNPADLLRAYAAKPEKNFARYVAAQPIAFTVLIATNRLPWARLHPEQIINAKNDQAVAAYEIGVTGWGLPVTVATRFAADIGNRRLPALNLVNESILPTDGCRKLVERRGKGWALTADGKTWIELLTFVP